MSSRRRVVVRVHSADAPKRNFSVSVPQSFDWDAFKVSVRRCLDISPGVPIELRIASGFHNLGVVDCEELSMKRLTSTVVLEVSVSACEIKDDDDTVGQNHDPGINSSSSDRDESTTPCLDGEDMYFRLLLYEESQPSTWKPKTLAKIKRIRSKASEIEWFAGEAEAFYTQLVSPLCRARVVSSLVPSNIVKPVSIASLKANLRIAIILCHGGRFAGGIFNSCGRSVVHKVFSRYVVRRKQGGRQGALDRNFRSAGSAIRYDQEDKLFSDIGQLLRSWDFSMCTHIFLFAPSILNEKAVYQDGALRKGDPRIRSIPIPTRRPTFTEVKRVFRQLTYLHLEKSWVTSLAV